MKAIRVIFAVPLVVAGFLVGAAAMATFVVAAICILAVAGIGAALITLGMWVAE